MTLDLWQVGNIWYRPRGSDYLYQGIYGIQFSTGHFSVPGGLNITT